MSILLAAETVVLVLMGLLVVGLLRSHAEILVRLNGLESRRGTTRDEPALDPSLPSVPDDRNTPTPSEVRGTNLAGDPVQIGFGSGSPNMLLAFLSSGCDTCGRFWQAFREEKQLRLPGGARLIVVTKDTQLESPSRLQKLAPRSVPVVMSSGAWDAFGVPVSPYFVLIDGATGKVAGEGAAANWKQMHQLLEDAFADAEMAREAELPEQRRPDRRARDSHPDRIRQADRALISAGIGPDHPSLWPSKDHSPAPSAEA